MNICPCCTNILLRHLNAQKITWFCLQCRQEMPIVNLNKQYLYVDSTLNEEHQQRSHSLTMSSKPKTT